MPRVFGFAGYCGVGKTEAITFCESSSFGSRLYVGQFILDELQARKLTRSPESEKDIRIELRKQNGPAYLAALASPLIERQLQAGTHVLIDAVASLDEVEFYRRKFDGCFDLVAIRSPFELRVARLAERNVRTMNENEISARDEIERRDMKIDLVLNSASIIIDNTASIDALHSSLRKLIGF